MLYGLIVADIIMAASFILRFASLPPQIPLIYSQPWGEDQLVDFWLILLLPLALHICFFFNIYLYQRLFFPDYFIRKLIYTINISLTIIFTLLFVKIIFYIT